MKALFKIGFLLLTAYCINAQSDGNELPDNCIETFSARLLLCQERSETNPVDKIRDILVNQLNLVQFQYKIVQAAWINDGLIFEMSTPEEASEVLAQYSKLKDLGIVELEPIESTTRDFEGNPGFGRKLTAPIDVRFGEF